MDKILKYVNIKAILVDLLIPYLEKFVADTTNPYDDKLIVWFKEWADKNV